jgi:hypothetical protein
LLEDAVEARHPIVVTSDGFPIDDAGPRAEPSQELHDQRETIRQIIAWPAIEPHPIAVFASDDAETIVLDLLQP